MKKERKQRLFSNITTFSSDPFLNGADNIKDDLEGFMYRIKR